MVRGLGRIQPAGVRTQQCQVLVQMYMAMADPAVSIVIAIAGTVAICGLVYNCLWGTDRRLFRSREYCYKDLAVPIVSDAEFCEFPAFKAAGVPARYVAAKRFQLCDLHLDYPPERLAPDMIWEEIPTINSPWGEDTDDLYWYIKRTLGKEMRDFLASKTVAQLIMDFYEVERRILWCDAPYEPALWPLDKKRLKRKTKDGSLPSDYFRRTTVAEVLADAYELRLQDQTGKGKRAHNPRRCSE